MSSVPIGPIVNAAGKLGSWLVAAHEEEAETTSLVRHALRVSLCRYDPCRPGVDEVAARIEARMWELAAIAPERAGRFERMTTRVRSWLPKVRRHVSQDGLDFPQWRRELEDWVRAAAADIDLAGAGLDCRSSPTDAAGLADRFPTMFHLELVAPSRMTPFRVKLLDRLKAADDRKASISRAFGDTQLWLTGAFGGGAAAVGLTIAEVAQWSDPGIAAGVGGVAGLIFGLIQRRPHEALSKDQGLARADVQQWIYVYLRMLTGAPADEHPLVMLQQAIEEESTRRHEASPLGRVVAARRRSKVTEDLHSLRQRLRWNLIARADAAHDEHIVIALRSLDAAMDVSDATQDNDEVLPWLHQLMVALEIAPPMSERDTKPSREDPAPPEHQDQPVPA